MAKILITGSVGFIGFHLSKKLLERGEDVVGIDNLNDYHDVNLKKSRLEILNDYKNYTHINEAIENRTVIEEIFRSNKPNKVVNLAAQAGVRYSIENPHAYVDSNIVGFVNILEGCRHNDVEHFVFASSSSVYGANTKMPFSVHDNVDHPVSLYAASKKANELMAHSYSHLYNLPCTGLRFFTVYGPWGRPDMAYFSFTKNILENKPIDIFNHGNMKRDFTYIDDIVSGIANSLEHKCDFEIFNLGNNNPVNILDFISILEKHLNKKALKNLLPMRKEEVFQTFADIEKSKKHLLFSPKYDLEKGLEKFVSWYKNYY